jgi:protein tyrosine/serine phosphatase
MLVAECLRVFVGANFDCVVPGKCYRASQPSANFLGQVQRTHGIRSIVNLRDENEEDAWYLEEKVAAERLGLALVNAGLNGNEFTPAHEFRKDVKLIDDAPEPMLIHCASGSDRTGLASAVYLLLRTDTPLEIARRQLALRYGHFAWTKKGCLDETLENYAKWLSKHGRQHNRERFLDWVDHVYPDAE